MPEITSSRALSQVIRETRTQLGIVAEDLAGIVGISAVTLRRFEGGKPTEAIESLFRICSELGIQLTASPPPGVVIPIDEGPTQKRTRAKS